MIGETVTRQRAGTTTDRYGATVPDWSTPDELTIDGCTLAPIKAGEDHDQGRQGVVIGWTLYAPQGADIVAADRIVARGDDYEVDGEPAAWVDPYSGISTGIEITLRVVAG